MMRAVRRYRAFGALLRAGDGERTDAPRDLFAPLDDLLVRGGDPRVTLDPVSRVNDYGCGPQPAPDILGFASSTASPISERAYARVTIAREELMRSSIELGFQEAYDARLEAMREALRACLQLSAAEADVVFSPSGTDSQLHALFLTRALLGEKVTTVVVGSDQTGSGTAHTARGRHFGARTASGKAVDRDAAIAGLPCDSIALPLCDGRSEIGPRADIDAAVLAAVETAIGRGAAVLLQIMDSSKLGWRAPGEACLDEIARKWPGRVQVVVDACQMRLGRQRLRTCLDRGYIVLVTGSKYFGGPAFSGALLVPSGLSRLLDRAKAAPGLLDYASGSDWPKGWSTLRARFPNRLNFGQWLRWEAALAEMDAYYRLPAAFRSRAMAELSAGLGSLIALSPSLRPIERPNASMSDDEFAVPTILPFLVDDGRGPMPPTDGRKLHRALMQDLRDGIAASAADREVAACRCLIGQPVALQTRGRQPIAALRLCVGARHIIDAWSEDPAVAEQNLLREVDRAAQVVAKIELLLRRSGSDDVMGCADER